MATNTYQDQEKKEKKSLFSKLENMTRLDPACEDGVPVKFMPYSIYITLVGSFYIGNTHYAEKTSRKINKFQNEVEELRADYTTLKANFMKDSKQSEVAEKVKRLGLEESIVPPYRIDADLEEIVTLANR
jgi:hypothetical protein